MLAFTQLLGVGFATAAEDKSSSRGEVSRGCSQLHLAKAPAKRVG